MAGRTKLLMVVIACLAGWLLPSAAHAQDNLPPGFEMRTTVGGFSTPVGMAYAPDGRIFVVEKSGILKVARGDGTLAPKTLLDISGKVNDNHDRGMLGVAVDKDFATNGYVYLLYVFDVKPLTPDSDAPMVSRLTRVKVNADNTLANPSNPETILLGSYSSGPCPHPTNNSIDCIPADYHWHNIGTVRVDPVDGTLWVGSGDVSEIMWKHLTMRTFAEDSFAGKIIHIDREGRGLPNHPFCEGETDYTKVCTKIYAKGFRNPFRFTLRPGTGPIVGDVGNYQMEEIDLVKPGKNYGWPCWEGTVKSPDYESQPLCVEEYAKTGTPDASEKPAHSWAHFTGDGGASATGGPLYTGTKYPPEYRGDILFGDHARGWVQRLELDANGNPTGVKPFFDGLLHTIVDLQQDPDGNLAYLDIGWAAEGAGKVRHIAYTGNRSPVVSATATPSSGPAPLSTVLKANATDPEGETLKYDWNFGDGTAHGTTATVSHTYRTVGPVKATVTVTDSFGNKTSDDVNISVGRRPVPTIQAPLSTFKYRNGVAVEFRGTATDAEDGTLSGTSLSWRVLLHHDAHIHDFTSATGTSGSFRPVADHDADSYYEIRLTATDSDGLTTTKTVNIKPATRRFTLNSSPAGAPVTYDGVTGASPQSRQSAIGYRATITAAPSFASGGRTYRFHSWSDGGTRTHTATVPTVDGARVAYYRADELNTFVFRPSADMSLDSRTPTTVPGNAAWLAADADPARLALMRFGVTGLQGRKVVGVRLGLYSSAGATAAAGTVNRTLSSWSETATTWNTRPTLSGTQLGSYGAVGTAEWHELPLTADAVAGDGDLSVALTNTTAAGTLWGSRESWARPRLVVETEPLTETYTPVADAYTSAEFPTTSFGLEPALIVDADPERRSYLRFNVTGLAGKRVVGARLRMFNVNRSPVGGVVRRVPSNTWTESMTHSNRTAIETAALGSFGSVIENQWHEARLSAGIPTADGLYSFALTSADGDGAGWDSRQGAQPPQLILEYEPAG